MNIDIFWNGAFCALVVWLGLSLIDYCLRALFGRRFHVKIVDKWLNEWNYGVLAWSKNGAILRALETYRWEYQHGDIISVSKIEVTKLNR